MLIPHSSLRMLGTIFLLTSMISFSACKEDDVIIDEPELRIRKDAKDLTAQEKQDYVNAILTLKATPSPYSDTLSYYDTFVRWHQMAVEKSICTGLGVAHTNPAFPPWHRKILILYEDALREVSGKEITLPYWDWTDQASTDAVFASDLLGGDGDPNDEYALNDGPFRKDNWQLNLFTIKPNYMGLNPHPWIVRKLGAVIAGSDDYPGYDVSLPTQDDIDDCLAISTYDVEPWDCSGDRTPNSSFRFVLEGFLGNACDGGQAMHNIGHDWIAGFFEVPVGSVEMIPVESRIVTTFCDKTLRDTVPNNVRVGTMEPLDVSPGDPAFFMHHCNVDRVWYLWQQIGDNASKYAPTSGGPTGYNLNDELYPFDLFKGIGGMDNHGLTPLSMLNAEDLGYTYQ